jgi:hypothetical protein
MGIKPVINMCAGLYACHHNRNLDVKCQSAAENALRTALVARRDTIQSNSYQQGGLDACQAKL